MSNAEASQSPQQVIRRRALRIDQDPNQPLYLFTLTAHELAEIADVSRIGRDDDDAIIGYQRSEVRRHIEGISEYLAAGRVLFPNAIILALTPEVVFTPSRGHHWDGDPAVAGSLEIPAWTGSGPRPAWLVDGQQRATALRRSEHRAFPVPVSAFVSADVDVQRDQFVRINNAKPLPRGLISELLPAIPTALPSNLAGRKVPSLLCDALAHDEASPFRKLIHRPSTPPSERSAAVVVDTAVTSVIEESLEKPSGCLFPLRNLATGEVDVASAKRMLFTYWAGVRKAFPEAWGLPPHRSRLMHSAGIRIMGRLMDRVMGGVDLESADTAERVDADLDRLRPHCRWTSGTWEELNNLEWRQVQNVPSHVRLIADFLTRQLLGAP